MAYVKVLLTGNAVEYARNRINDLMWDTDDLTRAKNLGTLAMALPVNLESRDNVLVGLGEVDQRELIGFLIDQIHLFGRHLAEVGVNAAIDTEYFPDETDNLAEEVGLFIGMLADIRAALRAQTTQNPSAEK